MFLRFHGWLAGAALACCSFLVAAVPAEGQALQSAYPDVSPSRMEIYGLYSYFRPIEADVNNVYHPSIPVGGTAGVNYFFSKHYGVQGEGGFEPQGNNYDCMYTGQGGLVARGTLRRFVPFAHVLGGGAKIAGPAAQPCTWGYGVTAGVGVDYVLHGVGGHLAIRPLQADFEYNHVDYGVASASRTTGGVLKEQAVRLSAGLVFRFGGEAQSTLPTSLSCEANPGEVDAGMPVVVTSRSLNMHSRRPIYAWTTNGGRVSGEGETATVDTSGLAPGVYAVSGRVVKGGSGNFGECTARFSINGPQVVRQLTVSPSAMSCSANPTAVRPGQTSTITANAAGASNGTLTYSYTTTAGVVEGAGTTATFTPRGMVGGTATVTCSAVDGEGHSATASATVEVLPALIPAAPKARAICTMSFERDRARPARVDNAAKACLDDVALTLNSQPESRLAIIGSHGTDEEPLVAAQRAINAKMYLTQEKGIDASRVRARTGYLDGRLAQNMLVPAGASYMADQGAEIDVDEATVKPTRYQPYVTARAYGGRRRATTRRARHGRRSAATRRRTTRR